MLSDACNVRQRSLYVSVLLVRFLTHQRWISFSDLVAMECWNALRQGLFCFSRKINKRLKWNVGCRSPPSVLVCQQTKMEGFE